MATVATTTPIITTTLLTMTPDTTGTPAPWYRAAPILPIAPSVTSPTTRRQGRISAAMVCGILAHKIKKRAAQAALFFMLDTFHARQSAGGSTHRNQDAGRYLWAGVGSSLLSAHAV